MKQYLQQNIDTLSQSLNPSRLSLDSIYGILILALACVMLGFAFKNIKNVTYFVGVFVFLEIMHIIAFATPIGTEFPILQVLFKYDVFMALAQLCVGTRLSEALVKVQAYLNTTIGGAFYIVWYYVKMVVQYFAERI